MTALQAEQVWQQVFPNKPRPKLYVGKDYDEDGFRPLTDASEFINDMTDLTPAQVYALSSNNAIALRIAQQEYLELMQEINAIKGSDKVTKNPQALDLPDVFEDKKEASIYGQTYIPGKPALLNNGVLLGRTNDEVTELEKRDVQYRPDLFVQGGFIPTERQNRSIRAAAKDPSNPDGFPLVEKDGKFYVPVQQTYHPEYTGTYTKRLVNEKGEIIRPVSPDPDDPNAPRPVAAIPGRLDLKRSTRFNGKKHPPTRDVSEAPSVSSTPKRRRPDTPMDADIRENTPNKRLKINVLQPTLPTQLTQPTQSQTPPRPKHPNQYTKAREREQAAQAAAGAVPGGALSSGPPRMPNWGSMTAEELLDYKWTDDLLRACLRDHYEWLAPGDPAKARERRDKVVNAVNPVRSWSMVKKWADWRAQGKAERPRNKDKLSNGNGKKSAGGSKSGSKSGSRPSTPAAD